MDASRLVSRRTLMAAAVAAGPVSAAVWHFLSSASQGQSGAVGSSAASDPVIVPTDTFNPLIRVNLTPEPVASVTLSIDGPYRILAPGSPRILRHGERAEHLPVTVDGIGFRFGNDQIAIPQIEIVAAKSPSIWVGSSQYRGSVRIYRQPGDKLIAVNIVPMEEYLASVVNSEMPASFPAAARQAQAVIARTYVLSQMKGHPRFDVFATSRSQKYLGFQYLDENARRLAGESTGSREITRATAGIVCTWQGKVFTTYYTAVCGGRTVNGRSVFTDAAPPIKSVSCDWCRDSDRYRWSTSTEIGEASRLIKAQLAAEGQSFGTLRSISSAAVPEGDLPYYLVSDESRAQRVAGTTFRRTMPYGVLWSPHFSARVTGTEVQFSGRGHGHGVGFCQWGARGLGLAGRSALDILSYYYPGAAAVRLRSQ